MYVSMKFKGVHIISTREVPLCLHCIAIVVNSYFSFCGLRYNKLCNHCTNLDSIKFFPPPIYDLRDLCVCVV